MKEAKARNPNVRLYALPWAWPGWLRGDATAQGTATGGANPLLDNTNTTAAYVVDWIEGARTVHNLTIDFVSIWNEMDSALTAGGPVYVKQLRRELDARGFQSVQIVAYDGHSFGEITSAYGKDPELEKAVDIVGAHYPSTHGPGAAALGKKAWASEDYSQTSNTPIGAMCWARVINRNFVSGNLTATIAWKYAPLVRTPVSLVVSSPFCHSFIFATHSVLHLHLQFFMVRDVKSLLQLTPPVLLLLDHSPRFCPALWTRTTTAWPFRTRA